MQSLGSQLSPLWTLPFVGILLSIALCPLLAAKFWHHHFKKVAIGWAVIFGLPFWLMYRHSATHLMLHTFVLDYVPFVILLAALYTISGGILLKGSLRGTPIVNALLMLIGTALASIIGTTGASMLLIRPVLRANETRRHRAHTVVFFIFLVSNIGGALTPLGDPPLFLGFLHSVPFFWTLTHLWPMMLVCVGIVLGVYLVVDTFIYLVREEKVACEVTRTPLALEGKANLLLLVGVIAAVFMSGYWRPTHLQYGPWIKDGELILIDRPPAPAADPDKVDAMVMHDEHAHHGLSIPIPNVLRDVILLVLAGVSLLITAKNTRLANGFNWDPIVEVGWLFAGIFMTIIPAIAILQAGPDGAFRGIIQSVREPLHYFWAAGLLSSFLDNAPTYLVFFHTALGTFFAGQPEPDAVARLLAEKVDYLIAISCGAVFMGANSYIGNAPNFMVRAIAEEAGVKMPDFFSYILKYSLPVLGLTFAVVSWLFFLG